MGRLGFARLMSSRHRYAAMLSSTAGSSSETVEVSTPPASFLTDVRAWRDGRPGSTLGGQFVALPGNGIDSRYFWYSQDDGSGTQIGFDPGPTNPSLVGYSGIQVQLGIGIVADDDVADATQIAVDAIGDYTATRVDETVSITGDIDAGSVFSGRPWASRGAAGIWGAQYEHTIPNNFGMSQFVCCRANAPTEDGTRIRAMSVFVGSIYSQQLRLCLYEGGASDTDPTGATLVYDFGQLPAGLMTEQWHTLWASGDVSVGNGTRLWLCVVGSGGSTRVRFGSDSSAFATTSDFALQDLYDGTAAQPGGADPSVAPAATFPSGGVTGAGFVVAARVVYEVDPVGNAQWRRRYGIHVDPLTTACPASTGFTGNVMMGGALPPQAAGMYLTSESVGYGVGTADFRGAVYSGGVAVENPNGAVLLWDAGLVAEIDDDWVEVSAPTGGSAIAVPYTALLWWITRDNSSGAVIRFDSGGPNTASPPENPMDWPDSGLTGDEPEYELTAANPNMSVDPADSFEPTVITDASDTMPGNNPAARVGLGIDGFVINVP